MIKKIARWCNVSKYAAALWMLCLHPHSLCAPDLPVEEAETFIIEKKVAPSDEKSSREKKYSELHADLIADYERLMRCHAQLLRDIADAQDKCIDSFKRAAENIPKMSRERVRKEHERLKKLCDSLENVCFF